MKKQPQDLVIYMEIILCPVAWDLALFLDIIEKEKNTYKMSERQNKISIESHVIFKMTRATQVIYFSTPLAGILLLPNCHLGKFKNSFQSVISRLAAQPTS